MKRKTKDTLSLGPDVIQLLLPHRRPFLMVDRVETFSRSPQPTLGACRHITANEPLFAGHLPGLHLWPGALTIEGLAQSCSLLHAIVGMESAASEAGSQPDDVLAALRNLELGYQLHPGYRPAASQGLSPWLDHLPRNLTVAAAVDIKFVRPVFAGQRLDYRVTLSHQFGKAGRCDVEALVEGRAVATGTITGASGFALPQLPGDQ